MGRTDEGAKRPVKWQLPFLEDYWNLQNIDWQRTFQRRTQYTKDICFSQRVTDVWNVDIAPPTYKYQSPSQRVLPVLVFNVRVLFGRTSQRLPAVRGVSATRTRVRLSRHSASRTTW